MKRKIVSPEPAVANFWLFPASFLPLAQEKREPEKESWVCEGLYPSWCAESNLLMTIWPISEEATVQMTFTKPHTVVES